MSRARQLTLDDGESHFRTDLPVELLSGVVCHGEDQRKCIKQNVDEVGVELTVVAKPSWYF